MIFLMELVGSLPDTLEEISKYTFTAKYARYNKELGRRETWPEAVERVKQMHLGHFDGLSKEDLSEIDWAFRLIEQKRVAPSMRSMQFGGEAIESCHPRQYNCAVRHLDSIRAFAEIFYLLMCGCGVGIGLMPKFFNRLPNLVNATNKTGTVITYVIEDTKEGWADSIEALLSCYFVNTAYTGRRIIFDYSKIRKAGTPLITAGGKAPGYKPLKEAHRKIKVLLDRIIEDLGQDRLHTIDAYDVVMHIADAVLSGGVRRSATAIIFDKNDDLMMKAKVGNWFEENPQRARSNNSVLLVRNQTTKEEFEQIVQHTKEFGEPGFVFANNEDVLYNPCFEVGFIPVNQYGQAGVQMCNLTTINASKIDSEYDLYEAAHAAALIGTLQAAYTDFPYLSKVAKELTEDEALLGVSMTAMMEKPHIIFDDAVQRQAAEIVNRINEIWAQKLGIKPAARTTVIKPEGTSTLNFGSMASGIHPTHSQRMFRRIQANKRENVYQFFKSINPALCEASLYSAHQTDDVITFPVIVPEGSITKADLSALKHLELIKLTQQNWVNHGTTKYNKKDVSHNVSCTVIVQPNEWNQVIDFLYENREYFSAVSLLSHSGDKIYKQAPMEAVTADDEETFRRLINNLIPIDYTLLREASDHTELQAEASCAGGRCEVI